MDAEQMAQIKKKMDQVAGEILRTARSRLLLSLPFLGTAIGRLGLFNDDLVFALATRQYARRLEQPLPTRKN